VRADLRLWAERLRDSADLAVTLADVAGEYLAYRRRAQIEYELYVAAARDTVLRPLAVEWLDGMRELLRPLVGDAAAGSVAAVVDGVAGRWSLVAGRRPAAGRAGVGRGDPPPHRLSGASIG
jgi:DNA-binding transcriptional regulator YbjK